MSFGKLEIRYPDGKMATIELTDQGKALSQKVIAARNELRNQLYADITPEDFETTRRVLDLIRQRAAAIHARQ